MSNNDRSRYQRNALPPIRDILGDHFPQQSSSPYRFDDVRGALPSSGPSRGAYPSTTTIHGHGPYTASSSSQRHNLEDDYPSTAHGSYQSSRPSSRLSPSAQPTQGYSFDVFRPSESGTLVHASSSTRSQGILRTTRADAGKRYSAQVDEEEDDGNDSSKRYPCEVCGRRFGRPSSLRAHEVSHTDERPHVCPYPGCGRAFGIQSNMRRHYRNAHEGSGGEYVEHDSGQYYSRR